MAKRAVFKVVRRKGLDFQSAFHPMDTLPATYYIGKVTIDKSKRQAGLFCFKTLKDANNFINTNYDMICSLKILKVLPFKAVKRKNYYSSHFDIPQGTVRYLSVKVLKEVSL